MGKVIDITEKLSFEENPYLQIKNEKIEVNQDAPTVLKVMGLMAADDPGSKEVVGAYNLMFPEESKAKLEKLKLGFKDLVVVIQEAIALIAGKEEEQGE